MTGVQTCALPISIAEAHKACRLVIQGINELRVKTGQGPKTLPPQVPDDPLGEEIYKKHGAEYRERYLTSGKKARNASLDEFKDKLGVPVPRDPKYATVAGFILAELNHLCRSNQLPKRIAHMYRARNLPLKEIFRMRQDLAVSGQAEDRIHVGRQHRSTDQPLQVETTGVAQLSRTLQLPESRDIEATVVVRRCGAIHQFATLVAWRRAEAQRQHLVHEIAPDESGGVA